MVTVRLPAEHDPGKLGVSPKSSTTLVLKDPLKDGLMPDIYPAATYPRGGSVDFQFYRSENSCGLEWRRDEAGLHNLNRTRTNIMPKGR